MEPTQTKANQPLALMLFGLAVAIAALVAVFLLLVKPRLGSYTPYGTQLLSPRAAFDFSLTGPEGQPVGLADFKGKAVYVFFGFVNCPDVCPTTLQELGKVYKALNPAEQSRVQVVLITADPERDTPQRLAQYVKAFSPSFLGLGGSLKDIATTAQGYGVFFEKNQIKSPSEYNVAHTASVFLIDPAGNLNLIYSNGKTADTQKMLRDLRWVLSK
jgi:protein SCO1/2